MKRMLFVLLSVSLILLGVMPALAAGPAAKVSDLAWISGHYEGPIGKGMLEENWVESKGGTIGSFVRATNGEGATSMIELIVVEETMGSLTLRLKQWNPGWKERYREPQVMELVSIEPGKVVFKNTGEGGIRQLGYTKSGKNFTISVTPPSGEQRDIKLTSK